MNSTLQRARATQADIDRYEAFKAKKQARKLANQEKLRREFPVLFAKENAAAGIKTPAKTPKAKFTPRKKPSVPNNENNSAAKRFNSTAPTPRSTNHQIASVSSTTSSVISGAYATINSTKFSSTACLQLTSASASKKPRGATSASHNGGTNPSNQTPLKKTTGKTPIKVNTDRMTPRKTPVKNPRKAPLPSFHSSTLSSSQAEEKSSPVSSARTTVITNSISEPVKSPLRELNVAQVSTNSNVLSSEPELSADEHEDDAEAGEKDFNAGGEQDADVEAGVEAGAGAMHEEAVRDVLDFMLENNELDEQVHRRLSTQRFSARDIKRLSAIVLDGPDGPHSTLPLVHVTTQNGVGENDTEGDGEVVEEVTEEDMLNALRNAAADIESIAPNAKRQVVAVDQGKDEEEKEEEGELYAREEATEQEIQSLSAHEGDSGEAAEIAALAFATGISCKSTSFDGPDRSSASAAPESLTEGSVAAVKAASKQGGGYNRASFGGVLDALSALFSNGGIGSSGSGRSSRPNSQSYQGLSTTTDSEQEQEHLLIDDITTGTSCPAATAALGAEADTTFYEDIDAVSSPFLPADVSTEAIELTRRRVSTSQPFEIPQNELVDDEEVGVKEEEERAEEEEVGVKEEEEEEREEEERAEGEKGEKEKEIPVNTPQPTVPTHDALGNDDGPAATKDADSSPTSDAVSEYAAATTEAAAAEAYSTRLSTSSAASSESRSSIGSITSKASSVTQANAIFSSTTTTLPYTAASPPSSSSDINAAEQYCAEGEKVPQRASLLTGMQRQLEQVVTFPQAEVLGAAMCRGLFSAELAGRIDIDSHTKYIVTAQLLPVPFGDCGQSNGHGRTGVRIMMLKRYGDFKLLRSALLHAAQQHRDALKLQQHQHQKHNVDEVNDGARRQQHSELDMSCDSFSSAMASAITASRDGSPVPPTPKEATAAAAAASNTDKAVNVLAAPQCSMGSPTDIIPALPSRQMMALGMDVSQEGSFQQARQVFLNKWLQLVLQRQASESDDFRTILRKFFTS